MTNNHSTDLSVFDAWQRSILTGLLISFVLVSTPLRAVSAEDVIPSLPVVQVDETLASYIASRDVDTVNFHKPAVFKVVRVLNHIPTTAYTSRPQETDSTPFITADGSRVRDGIVAANFLKFGTKIRIPELFGDKIFEVHDRMNARYWHKVDIWMEDIAQAREHGVRRVTIEVVEPVTES